MAGLNMMAAQDVQELVKRDILTGMGIDIPNMEQDWEAGQVANTIIKHLADDGFLSIVTI